LRGIASVHAVTKPARTDAIPRKRIFVGAGFIGAGLALAVLATRTDVASAIALVVVLSFFLMTSSGVIGALLQVATPDHLRGRVIGVQSLLIQGGMPLGTLTLGAVGASIGIGPALAIAGLCVAAFSAVSLALVPVLRER